MSCDGEKHEFDEAGAIEPQICAALAGVSVEQIDEWREAGLLPGALWNDEAERDFPDEPDWFYDWNSLHRILAAAKLIDLGLPPDQIPATFAGFDRACEHWATDLIPKSLESCFPEQVDLWRFITERWHEAELGQLHRFADVIGIHPRRHEGLPCIRGRRVDTRTLISGHLSGMSDAQLAYSYRITPYQARRAIAFERAMRDCEPSRVLAAG